MAEEATPNSEGRAPEGAPRGFSLWRLLGALFRLVLIVGIVASSAALSYYWMTNKPKAQRRPKKPEATLVVAEPVHIESAHVTIDAMGTVTPARTIKLPSRVSGQIVEVSSNFVPGGRFKKGEWILRLDREDYELALAQRESDLTRMEANLRLEMGQQSVAESEYALLGEVANEEDEQLLLRQPQLDAAKAAIDNARAVVEEAQLHLRRTEILAPFNAAVQTRNADLGAYVTPGATLATLVDTDAYWVEVSIPVDELRWIDLEEKTGGAGSLARVYDETAWGEDVFRAGRVAGLMTDIEAQGRMARLLVEVKDPLHLGVEDGARYPLILGAFLRAKIEGKEIQHVMRVQRTALHDGNHVWIMTPEQTLDVREVRSVWSGDEEVYVADGINDGELLITSALAAPVQGMLLRTKEVSSEAEKENTPKTGGARRTADKP